MTVQLEAIYQSGVLRLLNKVDLRENQRVAVTVSDIVEEDWLDTDYHRFCEANADPTVSLAEVRQSLAAIRGSLTGDFIAEREERF